MTEVTRLIEAMRTGDPRAGDQLLPLVYDELRILAQHRLSNLPPGQTLQPTALVHEAWVRLADGDSGDWDSRGHFFAAAAESMRRILVDQARRKASLKRGGEIRRIELDPAIPLSVESAADLVALDEALGLFEEEHPAKAQLIKLRYFGGLTSEEAARAMGISRATAARYWSFGKSWLFLRIRDSESAS